MKVFLDDIRDPYKTKHVQLPVGPWEVVRNYDDFVKAITNYFNETGNMVEFVAFDHDLAEIHYHPSMMTNPDEYNKLYKEFKEKTGLDCARWLIEFCREKNLDLPNYIVHSMNPVGKANIETEIRQFQRERLK